MSPGKSPQLSKKDILSRELERIKRREEERTTKYLATKVGIPYLNLTIVSIDSDSLLTIPKEEAGKGKLVVVKRNASVLRIAVVNPGDSNTKKTIERLKKQGFKCKLYLISANSLKTGLKYYEHYIAKPVPLRGILILQKKELEEFESSLETTQELKKIIHKLSTSRLLAIVIAGAIKMEASDIHIEPEKKGIRLRYRIDGLLQDITDFPRKEYHFFLSRIKSLSDMLLNVSDVSQDGRFTIKIKDPREVKIIESIDIRSSVLPSAFGESIVMRLLGLSAIRLDLRDLGIRPELFEIAIQQVTRPHGMILSTGPTGSGKTTCLYSCLNYINKPGTKIITVEDPIEYRLQGITQTQISERKGQTFAQALKTIVRQDPDVLMLGEIRSKESASIALQFALTGHLVFSTLHTNDAAGAIPRLIDMGINKTSLPTAVNLIIAQRLVRKLCPHCKEAYEPPVELIDSTKKVFSLISPKSGVNIPRDMKTFYKPKGCSKCHGIGYKGRTGVFEFLTLSDTIEGLILKEASSFKLRMKAMEEGMLTLMQDAMLKVVDGTTSMEEVLRTIGSPRYIEQLYGKAIMSMLTRSLILDKSVLKWSKGLDTTDYKKIQKKFEKVKIDDSVEYLAATALRMEASDIHLEAGEKVFKTRLRVDGVLEEIAQIPKELFLPIITRIKELAGMKIEVHRKTQDGRFKIECADGQSYDTRISTIPSGYGESVIIRLLRPDIAVLPLKDLGVRQESLKIIQKTIQSPNGIIFVTGPTSAGKTTTLYAILSQLNTPEVKIFTVEDPIEYRLSGIIQTQVDRDEGYGFPEALRTLLRQNPNIIMIGETRDTETAQAAIQASLTGHLVLTTLHTNNAVESIQRLVSLDVNLRNIGSSLKAIIAQRLIKKLCPKCRKPVKIESRLLETLKAQLAEIPDIYAKPKQIELYQATGCSECRNKGYKGLMGLFEVMVVSEEIKNGILSSKSGSKLEQIAQREGMLTLYQDGLLKSLEGLTTLDEVVRVTGVELLPGSNIY